MNWTSTEPTQPGYYWFRTKPDNGVLMHVYWYQDLQSGIRRHLSVEPMLPYAWLSKPGFSLPGNGSSLDLVGEWCQHEIAP